MDLCRVPDCHDDAQLVVVGEGERDCPIKEALDGTKPLHFFAIGETKLSDGGISLEDNPFQKYRRESHPPATSYAIAKPSFCRPQTRKIHHDEVDVQLAGEVIATSG